MHEHWSVPRWIRALADPENQEDVLTGCATARELWAEDLGPWMQHPPECPRCRAVVAALEIVPDDVLDCPECRSSLEVVHHMVDELEHFDPVVALELPRAEEMLQEIDHLPLERQVEKVVEDLPLRQWGFCQRLLFEARGSWYEDPRTAHDRAVLAVAVAERLLPADYEARWIADLQAKAHAYLANAHRIFGSFAQAEAEFRIAERKLSAGVGSGREEARVLSLKASLLNDQHRHREALALLGRVERLHAARSERHEIGRIRLQRARFLKAFGQIPEAAEECARAMADLDPSRAPRLHLLARQNAVHYLVQAGLPERARSLFDALPSADEHMIRLRRSWIEADLLRAEGCPDAARQVYEKTRYEYAAAGLHYDAALVSLDLALAAYDDGNLTEVQRMAEQASVLLTRAEAKQEAFAALSLLLRGLEAEAVTLATLEHVRRRLAALQPS